MAEHRAPEAPPPGEAPSPGADRPQSAHSALWIWGAAAVLCLVAAVQVAGVLLRDRMERRRPALTAAPAEAPGAVPGREPAPPAEAPPRFGPEVTEVDVAAPAGSPVAEPSAAPVPAAPAPPPEPAAPRPAAVAAPAADRAAAGPGPSAPAPQAKAGTHALLVDVFLSQRYLREAEGRLDTLGLPHFVKEITRPGRGFRVAAAGGSDRAKARKALEAAGYACRDGKGGVEAYFYYRDEAGAAADALARAGVESTTEETRGDRPFWKLYAGPFSEPRARDAQGRLAAGGFKTTLERRP